MSYSKETLTKYVRNLNETTAKFMAMDTDDIKMTISSGNRKIGRVLNVSLPAIKTCCNCKECKHLCYDIKACMQYASCLEARIRNYVILVKDRNRYFSEIENKLNHRRKNKFFRWHVSGDIVDYDYFSRMVDIAKRHQDFIFWTYTKNYAVVNEYVANNGGTMEKAIPSNLAVMFSEWRGMEMENPYNFPIFTVRFNDEDEKQFRIDHNVCHKCPGNCDICKARKSGCVIGQSSYCDEH